MYNLLEITVENLWCTYITERTGLGNTEIIAGMGGTLNM